MAWGPEDEQKHPRSPDNGRWVEKIWDRLNFRPLGDGEAYHPSDFTLGEPDAQGRRKLLFRGHGGQQHGVVHRHQDHWRLKLAGESHRLRGSTPEEAGRHAAEITAQVRNQERGRPPAEQMRENVLDALNPQAALRREARKLFAELGLPEQSADNLVEEHMIYDRNPTVPIGDDTLDSILTMFVDMNTPPGYKQVHQFDEVGDVLSAWDEYLRRFDPHWEARFPGVAELLDNIEYDEEDWDEEG